MLKAFAQISELIEDFPQSSKVKIAPEKVPIHMPNWGVHDIKWCHLQTITHHTTMISNDAIKQTKLSLNLEIFFFPLL